MGGSSSSRLPADEFDGIIPRDDPIDETSCARGAGFFCRNQNGNNPNMTAEEFQEYATEAAITLAGVEDLDTVDVIAEAVCNTGDQLFRNLATLALNITAGLVERTTPHNNLMFPTVGDALDRGISAAINNEISLEDRKEVKRMLEQINENVSINVGAGCEVDEDDEDDDGEDDGSTTVSSCEIEDDNHPGKILICHKNRNTLSISSSAWPAHEAHGDTCGPCN